MQNEFKYLPIAEPWRPRPLSRGFGGINEDIDSNKGQDEPIVSGFSQGNQYSTPTEVAPNSSLYITINGALYSIDLYASAAYAGTQNYPIAEP